MKKKFTKPFPTKKLAVIAIMTALQIVLSRFLSINTETLKIGFAFIPVMLSGYLYGIPGGIAVAAVGDLIGALLFPVGPYFPGFTFTAALTGLSYGLAMRKGFKFVYTLAAILFNELICSLLINTFWISTLYGSPFVAVLTARIGQVAVSLVVEAIFAYFVLGKAKFLDRLKF